MVLGAGSWWFSHRFLPPNDPPNSSRMAPRRATAAVPCRAPVRPEDEECIAARLRHLNGTGAVEHFRRNLNHYDENKGERGREGNREMMISYSSGF